MSLSKIEVSTSVEGAYTLAELMDLLGSPKKLKDALSDIEAAAKKNAKALRDLKKAEDQRRADVIADEGIRQKEIDAIHRDKAKLEAAWQQLEEATAVHEARHKEKADKLKAEIAAHKKQVEGLENARATISASQSQQERQNAALRDEMAKVQAEAKKDREAGERALAKAKEINDEANRKIAEMRQLVA
jgi:chromosome segregation ATPase